MAVKVRFSMVNDSSSYSEARALSSDTPGMVVYKKYETSERPGACYIGGKFYGGVFDVRYDSSSKSVVKYSDYDSSAVVCAIPSVSLNGVYSTDVSFYAPTDVGTNGYYLKSNGSGSPVWAPVSGGGGHSYDASFGIIVGGTDTSYIKLNAYSNSLDSSYSVYTGVGTTSDGSVGVYERSPFETAYVSTSSSSVDWYTNRNESGGRLVSRSNAYCASSFSSSVSLNVHVNTDGTPDSDHYLVVCNSGSTDSYVRLTVSSDSSSVNFIHPKFPILLEHGTGREFSLTKKYANNSYVYTMTVSNVLYFGDVSFVIENV